MDLKRKNLIKRLDVLARTLVKERDDWTCQKCGIKTHANQWCHYAGRRNKAIRWDLDNAVTLCEKCHEYMDKNHKTKFKDFMIKRLGDTRYYALMGRQGTYFKESEGNLLDALKRLKDGRSSYV